MQALSVHVYIVCSDESTLAMASSSKAKTSTKRSSEESLLSAEYWRKLVQGSRTKTDVPWDLSRIVSQPFFGNAISYMTNICVCVLAASTTHLR